MVIPYSEIGLIDPDLFFISAVIFFLGMFASIPVERYRIEILRAYPLWVWKRVRESLEPEDPWLRLFLFIFSFNSVSLLANLLSGFLVVLPLFMAFLLGMNLGVIAIEETGPTGILAMTFLNPVAWLELPAAWISLALALELSSTIYKDGIVQGAMFFGTAIRVYIFLIIPILLIAALLESTLIKFLSSFADDQRPNKETI